MSLESSIVADRELSKFLVRSSDAIDLLLGGMMEAMAEHSKDDPVIAAISRAINELHMGVRWPILKVYPEFDTDQRA